MMAGLNVMNRRYHHDNIIQHDYLGGTGIVKSKTSIAITGSSNRNHHGDIRTDKRHERSARTGNVNMVSDVTRSGGSGSHVGGSSGTNGQIAGSRKNSRQRQRPSDSKAVAKSKQSKDDVTAVESKNSPVPSVLPPIAAQLASSKNAERSPRVVESSASNNMPPSLSLAPTRLAIRQSTSPDINNKNTCNNTNNNNSNLHDHVDSSNNVKLSASMQIQGAKRNSLSRSDTTNCIRLPSNTNNNNNIHNTSPPPRSPRLVSETSRLSPINSQDKPKTKFEKKVMKSMIDNTVPTSPRAYRLGSSDTNPQQQQQQQNSSNAPQTKTDGKQAPSQRKQSIKSLPKLTPAEEQFSIRRKIEQFRKWHEEQHADNMKRLSSENTDEVFKTGATTNSRPSIPGLDPLVPTCSADVMDFAKLLEDKIFQNNLNDENNDETENKEENSNSHTNNNSNNNSNKKTTSVTTKGKRGNAINSKSKNRPISGATWKTWRGVNESDAYDDVNKYIHDNDLMDPEREEWIKSWIKDVGVAMSEMGDISIEV